MSRRFFTVSMQVLVAFLLCAVLAACGGTGSSTMDPDGDDTPEDGDDTPLDGDETPGDGDETDGDDADGDVTEDGDETDGDHDGVESASLFLQGCPEPGLATAMEIVNPKLRMSGPDAIGTVGDMLLMNEKAAFIISAPWNINAYYLYGGIPVDAVALNGCEQAAEEQFEEIAFMVGNLQLPDYAMSVLHAFRGETIEVLNDGSDGEAAVVRVTGTDDLFWLVEQVLLQEAFWKGLEKNLSDLFGLTIVIDYILPPDSPVLQIKATVQNTQDGALDLIVGSEIMFGNTTPIRYYADSEINMAGYQLEKGIPWIAASDGKGAWAAAMRGADMVSTNIGGLAALLDFKQLLEAPIKLSPAGDEGDLVELGWLLAVGPTDSNSAVRHLHTLNPTPIPGKSYTLKEVEGRVTERPSGLGIAGALVELQADSGNEKWRVMDSFHTDADGKFSGVLPNFGSKTPPYRLQAFSDGRTASEPLPIVLKELESCAIEMDRAGSLTVEVVDDENTPIPAKILLYQGENLARRIFHVPGAGPYPLTPGAYTFSVSRGYEYEVYEDTLNLDPGEEVPVSVVLAHLVKTPGYLSVDTHVHAQPSPDNVISIPERIRTVAGEGLDVVVSTDHEFVADWWWGVEENGLEDFVATVIGQEITASSPNHVNGFPFVPDFSVNARGGFVPWYGLDIAEIFEAIRNRGAEYVQLNHPRGRNYLSLIGWDRIAGAPTLDDPRALGLAADAVLWDWDFDAIEYMNDPEFVFVNPGSPDTTGLFDDWMSFLNHGHPKTAVGVSDAHDYGMPGRPRNYYPVASDDLADFDEDEMVAALKQGRSLVSAGAFAEILVNDTAGMGDLLTITEDEISLWLQIKAIPAVDVTYFKVYVNCDQVLTVATSDPGEVVKYDGMVSVPVTTDAHVVVLGFGEQPIPAAFGNYNPRGIPRFTTNAVFIDRDGNGTFDPPGGKTCTYDLDGPAEETR